MINFLERLSLPLSPPLLNPVSVLVPAFEGFHELNQGVNGSERLTVSQIDADSANTFVASHEFQVGCIGLFEELLFKLCVAFNSEGDCDAGSVLCYDTTLVVVSRVVDTAVNRGGAGE